MKPGDLVMVIDPEVPDPIEVGDLAVLTEIDWDHHDRPEGILDSKGRRITGRGYFFFPGKEEVNRKFQRSSKTCGVMLLFERVALVAEAEATQEDPCV